VSGDGPVLDQVNLVVTDTAASSDFYRRLGVAVPEPDEAAADHVELPMPGGAVTLELDSRASARLWNASWRAAAGGTPVLLGFALPSRDAVDATYADLTGIGHVGVQPPFDAFWGARYAIVADPDGNQIGLMSPRDAERQVWPPAESPDA
jgi:catechol 2,3-dioxygenase-like lactoylglutathione lyase family enzyme